MSDVATASRQLPTHIDSTMLSAWNQCGKKFEYEYVYGLRPSALSVDLHAGATFAGTIETFYKLFWSGLDVQTALLRSHLTFQALWGDFELNKDSPKTKENMWIAVEDFVRAYPPASDPIQPFFSSGVPTFEFSFAIPLDFPGFPSHPSGGPFVYCGRPDLLGMLSNRIVVLDNKTSGRLASDWAKQWDLRSQFLGYCWAVSLTLAPCHTVVIRGTIIRKRDIEQVTATKLFAQWEIDRWFEQLRRNLHRLVRQWNDGYFDFNLGESCTSYGGCAFHDLCKSPTPQVWFDTFRRERWNPLLRNPINARQIIPGEAPPAPLSGKAA